MLYVRQMNSVLALRNWHCEIGIAKLKLALRNWYCEIRIAKLVLRIWHCEIGIAKFALRNSHCEIGIANFARVANTLRILAMRNFAKVL